jgi:hypothetical protein
LEEKIDMWQVNLSNPENETEIAIFISEAADEVDAGLKALKIVETNHNSQNLSAGYEVTLARRINYALVPDAGEVMYG